MPKPNELCTIELVQDINNTIEPGADSCLPHPIVSIFLPCNPFDFHQMSHWRVLHI
jgi:hypothetical protein